MRTPLPPVTYSPARPGGPLRVRYLLCLTCQSRAWKQCPVARHLIGEPEDVLPPLRLVPAGAQS